MLDAFIKHLDKVLEDNIVNMSNQIQLMQGSGKVLVDLRTKLPSIHADFLKEVSVDDATKPEIEDTTGDGAERETQ